MNKQNYGVDEIFNSPKDKQLNELNPQFEFDKYGIGVEDIKTEDERLLKQGNEAKESKGLFIVKTANRWIEHAKTRPIPKMLFGEFWFEGELCIFLTCPI